MHQDPVLLFKDLIKAATLVVGSEAARYGTAVTIDIHCSVGETKRTCSKRLVEYLRHSVDFIFSRGPLPRLVAHNEDTNRCMPDKRCSVDRKRMFAGCRSVFRPGLPSPWDRLLERFVREVLYEAV